MPELFLAQFALRDTLRPRRLIAGLVLILLPGLVGLFIRLHSAAADWDAASTYDALMVTIVFAFTLPLLAVIQGTGVIGQEVEQRTIVYLLTRPLPRWRILLVRFLVAFTVVAEVSVLSTLILALAVYGWSGVSFRELWPDIAALLVGSFAYTSVFLLLGTLIKRPLIYGLLFVFGWEKLALLPVLPGSFVRLAIISYLRVIAGREVTDAGAPGASQGAGGLLSSLAKPPDIDITHKEAYLTLTIISVIALVLAMIVFSNREYVPREEAD